MLKLKSRVKNGLATIRRKALAVVAVTSSLGTQNVNEKGNSMKAVGTAVSIGMIVSIVGAAVAMIYPEIHVAFCTVR